MYPNRNSIPPQYHGLAYSTLRINDHTLDEYLPSASLAFPHSRAQPRALQGLGALDNLPLELINHVLLHLQTFAHSSIFETSTVTPPSWLILSLSSKSWLHTRPTPYVGCSKSVPADGLPSKLYTQDCVHQSASIAAILVDTSIL